MKAFLSHVNTKAELTIYLSEKTYQSLQQKSQREFWLSITQQWKPTVPVRHCWYAGDGSQSA